MHRGVFGVPGTPYSLPLPRSHDFEPFFRIFDEKYEDEREKMLIIAGLLEQIWDVADPTAWAWDIAEPPSDVGDKQVLLQVAIGDAQVHSLGAHVQARSYGARFVTPQTRSVWGIEEQAPPFTGNAIVEWGIQTSNQNRTGRFLQMQTQTPMNVRDGIEQANNRSSDSLKRDR